MIALLFDRNSTLVMAFNVSENCRMTFLCFPNQDVYYEASNIARNLIYFPLIEKPINFLQTIVTVNDNIKIFPRLLIKTPSFSLRSINLSVILNGKYLNMQIYFLAYARFLPTTNILPSIYKHRQGYFVAPSNVFI